VARAGHEQEVLDPMFERTIRRLGLLGASAALVAACAGGGGAATTTPTSAPATTAPVATTAATQAAAGLTLAVATNATLGKYVTGANGMSLYVFKKDTAGTSACTGGCADNWPPVIVTMADDATAGAGITGTLGTITRADGKLQLTLAGHPLYYFKNDAAAGDVNGQGINDVWYLAGVDGSAVGEAGAATTAPGGSQCSGPTCY
jgi:predicted lipoprotein with Yx(FWY)xxD motif